MTAPSAIAALPDRQDAPSTAITPIDAAAVFQDPDSSAVPVSFALENMPPGTGISINSSTGQISLTPNSADLAYGDFTMRIRCTDSLGHSGYIDVPMVVADAPSAAAAFYINGSTGDDQDDGSIGSPWRTFARGNQVQPSPSGDTYIYVAPGVYRGQEIHPQNSGTDATHRIIWALSADGDVTIRGPSSGSAQYYGVNFDAGIQWVNLERTATRRFVVDGEVEFGTGSGEIQKGDSPESVARIRRGIRMAGGANCEVGVHLMRCSEWDGLSGYLTSGTCKMVFSSDQHGTPYYPGGADFGDTIQLFRAGRFCFDGKNLNLTIDRGGHGAGGAREGTMTMRLVGLDGRWGGFIDTFSTSEPDGNRAMTFCTKKAVYCHLYDSIIEGSGKAQDQSLQEGLKLEGRHNRITGTYHRRPHWNHIETASASWSSYAQDLRVAHAVFETCEGPIWEIRDYGSGTDGARLEDLEMLNCIAIEPATSDDRIITAFFNSGTWSQQFIGLKGLTIQAASRDLTDFRVTMSGAGGPGTINLQDALDDHGSVFSDIDVVTDANLDSRPSSSALGTPSDLATELELAGGDTASLGQGVPIAYVAASDPGSGTTLHLTDTGHLADPLDGTAAAGVFTAFQFWCQGSNRTYTANNKALNRLTLSSGFSRSPGDPVHLRLLSGSAPHRGYPLQ